MRTHWSDCAVNNGPALPIGECDCGGLELADGAWPSGFLGRGLLELNVAVLLDGCLLQAVKLPFQLAKLGGVLAIS